MKHQGKIFEKAIRNSKISISEIARQAKYTSRHFYNLFEKEEIPNDMFIKVGRIIGYDYSIDVPDLTSFLMIREPSEAYNLNENYRQKYLELMEKHILLIEKLDKAIDKVEPIQYKKIPVKKKPK